MSVRSSQRNNAVGEVMSIMLSLAYFYSFLTCCCCCHCNAGAKSSHCSQFLAHRSKHSATILHSRPATGPDYNDMWIML